MVKNTLTSKVFGEMGMSAGATASYWSGPTTLAWGAPGVSILTLAEPPKDQVLRGAPIPRRAFTVMYDRPSSQTWEATVDLAASRLDSFKEIAGARVSARASRHQMSS